MLLLLYVINALVLGKIKDKTGWSANRINLLSKYNSSPIICISRSPDSMNEHVAIKAGEKSIFCYSFYILAFPEKQRRGLEKIVLIRSSLSTLFQSNKNSNAISICSMIHATTNSRGLAPQGTCNVLHSAYLTNRQTLLYHKRSSANSCLCHSNHSPRIAQGILRVQIILYLIISTYY